MAQSKIRASKQIYFDDNVDINAKKLTNLATPTLSADAATKAYVDGIIGGADAMTYQGAIDCSTNPNYPAGDAGDTYKVSVAGKIGGASGPDVEVGDMLICTADGTASGDHATVGASWNIIQVNTDGGVTGAASSTDNAIARWDGTTGGIVQDSNVTVDDSGSINIPSGQSYKKNGAALTQDDIGDGSTYKQYSATEQTKLAGIETGADVTDAVNVASTINGATAKTTPVDADELGLIDSAASNVLKKLTWANLKATLKTYFDTLYAAAGTYLQASGYVCREVPAGLLNGSNTVYTLANTPTSGTEMVFLNGILQNAGAGNDYTISAGTITMAVAPVSTDIILVTYWK